jgi:transcriptional regulator of acetoin/glycerol metabolism
MFLRKQIHEQIQTAGVRLGDSCSIFPSHGRKKAFTLNRHCIDLISSRYRPQGLSMSYIELPHFEANHFHYRLELDETTPQVGRFVLKTIKGNAFWINGLAAKEAYVERADRLYIEDHKFNFDPCDLGELSRDHFEHPVLKMMQLLRSDLKILIMGETGTGKTYLAKKIHEKSGKSGPFVSVNLSSFNPQLIESELFGHKRGAFTGAISDKMGSLAMAENGTLFLDEIDSLPFEVQTKLLTFLDNKKFRRVGEAKEYEANTRLIFASGRCLETLIQQGQFRKDFYYRLKSGHSLELKALRNDVKRIRDTCQQFALNNGISFSLQIIEFYESLAWPGNLRQLLGHLEKKKVLSKGTKIDFDSLDEELLLQSSDLMSLPGYEEILSMKQCKFEHVRRVLNHCDGNISLAARKLLLTEKTVRSILHEVS